MTRNQNISLEVDRQVTEALTRSKIVSDKCIHSHTDKREGEEERKSRKNNPQESSTAGRRY
jgi:hypothetical protein